MESKELKEKIKEWDHEVSHPLQSWEWGEFRTAMGIDVVRLQQCQITFHKLPHLPFTIGYFPKGPTPSPEMITTLKKLGKEKNAIFIQLEPNIIPNGESRTTNLDHHSSLEIYRSSFLHPSHHPLFTKYTFVLDLTKSEDELLKNMHSKTRYNLKVAQKHHVIIKEDNSQEAFAEYLRLTQETTERQGFYAHTPRYHTKMWETLSPSGIAKLFTAAYNGKILAAWIIFCWQDTIYYPYGSSSRDHREVMAPTLLLWEIAKWGKTNGYKQFDLWGAMAPNPDTTDPWYGFHRFKEGFHPNLIEFVGSYDLIINPILYSFYCLADDLRWKLLRKNR